MALETGTYISDLVATNPVHATDDPGEGDDHLRLLKSTIKATFPNISGAVTPTHTELNYVDGVTSAIQTQLDGLTYLSQNLDPAGGGTTYTLDLTDANKHLYKNGTSAETWTIPPNSSKAFTIGTSIMFVNAATSSITIARGSGVALKWMNGTGTDANRTLAAWGWCLLLKVATDTWLIGGSGLT